MLLVNFLSVIGVCCPEILSSVKSWDMLIL